MFDPTNHYWKLDDGRVWSTSKSAFVDATEAAEWLPLSGMSIIPASPVDEQGEHSEAGLRAALVFYELPLGELQPVGDVIAAKTAAVQAEKCRVRDGGFQVDGVLFDSDQAARTSYLELADQLAADASYTTPWKASANSWVTMDATLYAKVKAAGTVHMQACFAWQAARDADVATIKAAVEAGTMAGADALVALAAVSTTYTGGEAGSTAG